MLIPKGRDKKIHHPACFPEKLVTNYLEFFTKKNSLILDPFLGSGTTLITARQTQRNTIGIELSQKYTKLYKERLNEIEQAPIMRDYLEREKEFGYAEGYSLFGGFSLAIASCLGVLFLDKRNDRREDRELAAFRKVKKAD